MLALCVYMVDCTGELGGPLGSSRARFQADKVCGIRSQHTLAQYGMFGSIRAVGIITTRLSTLEYKVITGRKLFSDQDPPTRVTERLKKKGPVCRILGRVAQRGACRQTTARHEVQFGPTDVLGTGK